MSLNIIQNEDKLRIRNVNAENIDLLNLNDLKFKKVYIDSSDLSDMKCIEKIADMIKKNNLKHFCIGYSKITNEGLRMIAQAIKKSSIKTVDLSMNSIDEYGIDILRQAVEYRKMPRLLKTNVKSPKKDEQNTLLNRQKRIVNLLGGTGLGHGIIVKPYLDKQTLMALRATSAEFDHVYSPIKISIDQITLQ